jgi:hypothetical protein
MAGVGAAREAVGARSISTSSTSKLSSPLSVGGYDWGDETTSEA